ncbi:MAG: COX15/CtaA family protein [Myxococcaceae bacterium]
MPAEIPHPLVRRAAWATLGWSVAVIVYGAFVRATKSGNGCGDHWPACNGEVIPQSPTLKTIIEFAHRATSGIALILTVLLLTVALWKLPKGHVVRKGAFWSVFFMLMEAAVGAVLVKTGWVAMNESLGRAIFMAIHLANTFFLLAALTLTTVWVEGAPSLRLSGRGTAGMLVLGALFTVLVLGVSGAVTALGDTLFPTPTLAEGLAKYHSPAAQILLPLRLLHPLVAIAAGVLTLAAGTSAFAKRADERTRRAGIFLAVVFVLQLCAGMLNVSLQAPVWLQLVHLLVADLVWIGLVRLAAATFADDAGTVAAPVVAPVVAAET